MRTGEHFEIIEVDSGDAGRLGAIERVGDVELLVALVLGVIVVRTGGLVVVVVVIIIGIAVMVMLGLELHLGVGDRASRAQLEHRERLGELRLGLLHGDLLVVGGHVVLEGSDVHAGHLELHGDALVLHRDVEIAVAVHVGAELPGAHRPRGQA